MSKLVFIATREPTYSRVSLMRQGLHEHYEVRDILSTQTRYSLRLLSIVTQTLWCWMTGRLRRCDGVVVGFFAQPIFPLVRLLYRGPIIADAYFSIFDTVVHDKQTATANSIRGRLCRWLDTHMLKHAALCLTDTQAHVDYFKSQFAVPSANLSRLWISAESQPLVKKRDTYEAGQPFEVFFWGGFIPLQGVETIVQAAAQLKSEQVRFTIFGHGQTLDKCQAMARELQTTNVQFYGWKSAADIRAQASQSHLALGIFGATPKAARVIPNKAFEALAMGIPLLTRTSPAIAEWLQDGHELFTVPPAQPDALAAKILSVRENYNEALEIAQRGQAAFQAIAAPAQVTKILCECVEQTLRLHSRKKTSPRRQGEPSHAISNATGVLQSRRSKP